MKLAARAAAQDLKRWQTGNCLGTGAADMNCVERRKESAGNGLIAITNDSIAVVYEAEATDNKLGVFLCSGECRLRRT